MGIRAARVHGGAKYVGTVKSIFSSRVRGIAALWRSDEWKQARIDELGTQRWVIPVLFSANMAH